MTWGGQWKGLNWTSTLCSEASGVENNNCLVVNSQHTQQSATNWAAGGWGRRCPSGFAAVITVWEQCVSISSHLGDEWPQWPGAGLMISHVLLAAHGYPDTAGSMGWWAEQSFGLQVESGFGAYFCFISVYGERGRGSPRFPSRRDWLPNIWGVVSYWLSTVRPFGDCWKRPAHTRSCPFQANPCPCLMELSTNSFHFGPTQDDSENCPFCSRAFLGVSDVVGAVLQHKLLSLSIDACFPLLGYWSWGCSLMNSKLHFRCAFWRTPTATLHELGPIL